MVVNANILLCLLKMNLAKLWLTDTIISPWLHFSTLTQQIWEGFNPLWPSDTIWRCRSGSTLALVMACCLTAPSHYQNQCWLIISHVLWHSSEGIIMGNLKISISQSRLKIAYLKITSRSHSGQSIFHLSFCQLTTSPDRQSQAHADRGQTNRQTDRQTDITIPLLNLSNYRYKRMTSTITISTYMYIYI